MTPQEIFNTVKKHLLTQGEPALNREGGSCSYRGTNGTKCAVGCLIKDEFYTQALEGKTSGHPWVRISLMKSGIDSDHKIDNNHSVADLLYNLQEVHDDSLPKNWRTLLDRVAADYGLNPDSVIA